jgi:hypothetical protein
MNLINALECITNSNSIHKLDGNLSLNDNIASDKIDWSHFDSLSVVNTDRYNQYSIDKITSFNGELALQSVAVGKIGGNLKSLNVTTSAYHSSPSTYISFEDNTSIKDMVFKSNYMDLSNDSYIPIIDNAIIMMDDEYYSGSRSIKGLLSKTKNISLDENSLHNVWYYRKLGYLTTSNEHNPNWANVTVNQFSGVSVNNLVVPTGFYENLVLYVTDRYKHHLTLDYVNDVAADEDEEGYANIIVPATLARDYISTGDVDSLDFNNKDGLPLILGEYCFGGIGSRVKGDKDRRLYLTFDNNFIFDTYTKKTNDDGATVKTITSTKSFKENTFLTRPNAIQQVHINIPERRPEDDLDTQNLYFSDFFTTCVKTKTTITVDNGDGTSTTTENIDTTFELDEEAFNSYKNQLLAMVDGDAENLVFGSQYEDIEAYIDVDN